MAITIHLFGFREDAVTVAHCGRRGRGLSASTVLAAVTCRECKRRDQRDDRPRLIRRPNGPGVVVDNDKAKAKT